MKQQWNWPKVIAGVTLSLFCLEISNISAQEKHASAKAPITIPQSRTDSEMIFGPSSNTASGSINLEDKVLTGLFHSDFWRLICGPSGIEQFLN
jgi:hypothetical protein